MKFPAFLHSALGLALGLTASTAQGASRLTNVSVRSTAGAGADTLIVGFTVTGSGGKPVLIRGVGPTLGVFNVTNAVTDPELRLFNQANIQFAQNDNWSGAANISSTAAAVGAFALPANSADAAILTTLAPGSYSAHIAAKSGPGTALIEAYDADSANTAAQISNVSARSLAGTGAAVLTVGFSITGDTDATVLIRAVGPSLSPFGVTGVLANPQLRLFSGRGTELSTNDDWVSAAGWGAAFSAVGAFTLGTGTRDAALLVRLSPGSYTAQASGVSNTTGVALIEVYDVPNPPVTSFVLRPMETIAPATGPGSTPSTFPVVLLQARPQYPFELRRAGISGEALIDFVVNPEGLVVSAFVLRASDIAFGESALAAVQQWVFRPGLNASGQPISTHMQVPIVFTLN